MVIDKNNFLFLLITCIIKVEFLYLARGTNSTHPGGGHVWILNFVNGAGYREDGKEINDNGGLGLSCLV